jgi:ATP-dependent Clp protease ATP-binding subunit ClpA
MSEFSSEHSDQRLLGAPPSYVGYEEGGQLTNAVKERPFSVLLFDEIDKADPSILDKFLQILDDGRLTDGKGETVYFSECIIIFTSNEGVKALNGRLSDLRNDLTASSKHASELLPYKDVKTILLGEIRKKFEVTIGRPEILNRFGDNFVVFDFIRPGVAEEIVSLLIGDLQKALVEERNIELTVGDGAREWVLTTALKDLSFGGRGIRNLIDTALVNPLARWLFDQDIKTNASLLLKNIKDNGNAEDESSNFNAQHRFELEIVQQSKCL